MKDFEIKLKFEDAGLTAAILTALMEIQAKQDAMHILLLEEIARRSKRDVDGLMEAYANMVQDLKLKNLADLEMNYSESRQLELAGEKKSE